MFRPHAATRMAAIFCLFGVSCQTLTGDVEVIPATQLLPEVPDAALGPYLQLWPHRHGTDAMFAAYLRKTG